MTEWTLDPALTLCARLLLIALFAGSLTHKLKSPTEFIESVSQYELISARLSTAAAWLFIACELIAIALLALGRPEGAVAAITLLVVYTAAISINLMRGRTDIDCGCAGPAARQSLSSWLIVRNVALTAVAVVAMIPSEIRSLGTLDLITVVSVVISGSLCYAAFNALAATHDSSATT
jgi:uncharacterized membrane protein YphA (DoxX/SURF4 family)